MKLYQRQDVLVYLEKFLKNNMDKNDKELLQELEIPEFYFDPIRKKDKDTNSDSLVSYHIIDANTDKLIGEVSFLIQFKDLTKSEMQNRHFDEIVAKVEIKNFSIYRKN